jgi:hypothetical protein
MPNEIKYEEIIPLEAKQRLGRTVQVQKLNSFLQKL